MDNTRINLDAKRHRLAPIMFIKQMALLIKPFFIREIRQLQKSTQINVTDKTDNVVCKLSLK